MRACNITQCSQGKTTTTITTTRTVCKKMKHLSIHLLRPLPPALSRWSAGASPTCHWATAGLLPVKTITKSSCVCLCVCLCLLLASAVPGQHQELLPLHDRERSEGQNPEEPGRHAEELHGEVAHGVILPPSWCSSSSRAGGTDFSCTLLLMSRYQ